MRHRSPPRGGRGVTLVESLVGVAIAAAVVGLAAPAMATLQQRESLRSVAALLETDVVHARSWAVARNRSARLDFDGPSCWVLHGGPPGDCRCDGRGGATCGAGMPWRVSELHGNGVAVDSNSPSLVFDPVRGTVTPTATVRLRAGDDEIRAIVNLMGRVRQCSPAAMPGLPRC